METSQDKLRKSEDEMNSAIEQDCTHPTPHQIIDEFEVKVKGVQAPASLYYMNIRTILEIEHSFRYMDKSETSDCVETIYEFYKIIQHKEKNITNNIREYTQFYLSIITSHKDNLGCKFGTYQIRKAILEFGDDDLRLQTISIIEKCELDKPHNYREHIDYAEIFLGISKNEFYELALPAFFRKKILFEKKERKDVFRLCIVAFTSAFLGAGASFIFTLIN